MMKNQDLDAPEDKDKSEEKFVPKPYTGKLVSTSKKKAEKKKAEPKAPPQKPEDSTQQISLFGEGAA